MLTDLTGLIIKKRGDNYVNVNSRGKREEKESERKTAFLVGRLKKKQIDKKIWQKDRQQEIVRNINRSRSLHQKVYIKKFI